MKNVNDKILGLQHIGLPTSDVQKTVDFYSTFGFEIAWERLDPPENRVVFLKNGSCVVEIYYSSKPAMASGAVDHICLDVIDIEALFHYAHAKGFESIEGKIKDLPFYTRGVRYFTILGPNQEKLEFNQKL